MSRKMLNWEEKTEKKTNLINTEIWLTSFYHLKISNYYEKFVLIVKYRKIFIKNQKNKIETMANLLFYTVFSIF